MRHSISAIGPLLALLVLAGVDARALSPSSELRCCMGTRSACGENPPTPEECQQLLGHFAEMNRRLYPEPTVLDRIGSFFARLFDTGARNPRTVMWLALGLAFLAARFVFFERVSLAGRTLFVAGGSSLGFGLFLLYAGFR